MIVQAIQRSDSGQDFSSDSFLSDSMQEAMQSGLGASAIGLGMISS